MRVLAVATSVLVLAVGAVSRPAATGQVSFIERARFYPAPLAVICVVAPGGGAPVRAVGPAGRYVGFAWNPDGRQLAVVTEEKGRWRLQLMRPDGSARIGITTSWPRFRLNAMEPAWSPRGRLLAFVADDAIFVVRRDGSGLRRLAGVRSAREGLGGYSSPRWAPDGSRIYFLYWQVGPVSLRLLSIRPNGTGLRGESPMDRGSGRLAGVWSPDRRRRAYERWQDHAIVVVDADGSNARVVAAPSALRGEAIEWSPDGKALVFLRRAPGVPPPPADVYLAAADGSGSQQLTSTGFDEAAPSWRPNGGPSFGACEPPSLTRTVGRG
jgi:Tol biopolymer transport system component